MSTFFLVVLAIIVLGAVGLILWLVLSYLPVPQNHVVIVERFGRYNRTLASGPNFVFAPFEKPKLLRDWGTIAHKEGKFIELSEQHTDTAPRPAMTKDNVEVEADASVYWQILDPVRARYEVDRLPAAILDMALNVLRTALGSITLEQALVERARLNQYLLTHLTKACDKWGTKVIRVEVQTLRPMAGGAGEALLKEMAAERERRAIILLATGEKEATILRASADQEASILRAKGDAQAMLVRMNAELERLSKLTEKLGAAAGLRAALALRYMETLSAIAKDPAQKMLFANDALPGWTLARLLGSESRLATETPNDTVESDGVAHQQG